MKKLLLVLIICFPQFSISSHVPRGVDLSYIHVGGNEYEFIYRMYLDCSGDTTSLLPKTLRFQSSCFPSGSRSLPLQPAIRKNLK